MAHAYPHNLANDRLFEQYSRIIICKDVFHKTYLAVDISNITTIVQQYEILILVQDPYVLKKKRKEVLCMHI